MSETRTAPPADDREYMDGLPLCKHCGEDIFNHMQDGEPLYMCHPEHQRQATYGYFTGGDPRDFCPDYEDCSPQEIANHKQACAEAERLADKRELPCPSGWMRLPNGGVAHLLITPFGIGVQSYPPTCYEPNKAVS